MNNNVSKIYDWIDKIRSSTKVYVNKIPFEDLDLWSFDEEKLKHNSGKFFSIDGIEIRTNHGKVDRWDQPIINQPEIGILGIIAKEYDGVFHFLLQAKIEPGNINFVQLSPTLQATKSNYTKVHKGKTPDYLKYFLDKKRNIIIDQLQSEQGARFLQKRNRNMIIKVDEEFEHNDNYCWTTLSQIKDLMHENNVVNMDTRSVVAGLDITQKQRASFDRYSKQNGELYSFNELLSWIADQKTKYDLEVRRIALSEMRNWEITEDEIYHKDNKYFKVIAANVTIGNREVTHWTQPMVESAQEGLIAFVVKRINGVIHFIVQAKVEAGNLDIIELAPTVQCLTGNYRETGEGKLPFLDYVLNVNKNQKVFDTLQSEEGGRFYREQNRNMIIIAEDDFPNELPKNYTWMTYNQIQAFMMFNNYINIQARSLLAAIKRCDEEIN
jgi:dTDP-4-dehydro-6-deoxy-alpha-D-glucopyranose 2,3-dehydratase